jgi:hypothetical protein
MARGMMEDEGVLYMRKVLGARGTAGVANPDSRLASPRQRDRHGPTRTRPHGHPSPRVPFLQRGVRRESPDRRQGPRGIAHGACHLTVDLMPTAGSSKTVPVNTSGTRSRDRSTNPAPGGKPTVPNNTSGRLVPATPAAPVNKSGTTPGDRSTTRPQEQGQPFRSTHPERCREAGQHIRPRQPIPSTRPACLYHLS